VPDPFAAWLDRDVIGVTGPEAASYLQGQLSQDVLAIAEGRSAWSWLLSPQGKVDALLRATRLAEDDWLLDTDAGWGQVVVDRLNRFKLRTKVDIEARPFKVLAVPDVDVPLGGTGAVAAAEPWPGMSGVDLLGESPTVPSRIAVFDEGAYEFERITARMPRMGLELTDKTIPAETESIDWTVSFSKGCYTGQELVARIDSRGGNVARHLRLLKPDGELRPGEELFAGDAPAGVVTSVAGSESSELAALGYVKRGFEPPLRLRGAGGSAVEVVA
jgi:tRNA-modifying protein YgfZ